MTGLTLCVTILIVTVSQKFLEGGWITLVITSVVIGVCYLIRRHYNEVKNRIRELDEMLMDIPISGPKNEEPVDPKKMTAVQLVNGFNGFGVHTLLSIVRSFPNLYKNIIFVSVAVCDSGSFKGPEAVCDLTDSTREALEKYVDLARRLGLPAEYRFDMGTDVVESATQLCEKVAEEFPQVDILYRTVGFPASPISSRSCFTTKPLSRSSDVSSGMA